MKRVKDLGNRAIQAAALLALAIGMVVLFRAASRIPVPTLAKDPSGVIWYTTMNEVPISSEASTFTFANSALRIDEGGEADTATDLNTVSNEIDLLLENKAYAIYPSRNWDYLVAMKFSEPGGKPYVFDMKTMKLSDPLVDFAPGQFLGWHPDGRRFLFFVDGGGPWLVDAASSEITQLVYEMLIQGGAISPDGLRIAYIAQDALWFVSASGSDAKPIFPSGHQSYLYPTGWSPDGTKIVYFGSCDDTDILGPLCSFDLLTENRSQLKIPSFYGGNTTWSPDSQYVAATGFVEVDGSCAEVSLTSIEKDACQFDQARVIYIEDTKSGEVRQLISGYDPIWSPDGSKLAFISNRGGAQEIWLINFDGSGLIQLTSDGQPKGSLQVWLQEIEK